MIVRKVVCSCMGIILGTAALLFSYSCFQDTLPTLLEACSNAPSDMQAFEKTYHPFEPLLGGYVICVLTQLLHQLVLVYPTGMIVYVIAMSLALPKIVLLVLESGRCGIRTRGPLQSPAMIWLLGQLFSDSVAFPLVWIPAFCWCRETPIGNHLVPASYASSTSSTSWITRTMSCFQVRSRLVILFCLVPTLILTILAFALDLRTYEWTIVAGLLVGPGLALTALPVGILAPASEGGIVDDLSQHIVIEDDDYNTDETSLDMVNAAAAAYATAAALSFTAWAGVVFVAYHSYHFNLAALWDDLWNSSQNNNSEPAIVKFMVVNCIILYLSLLVHIAYVYIPAAIETLLLTVLFGPGAACALSLAKLEMNRSPIFAFPPKQQQEPVRTTSTSITTSLTSRRGKKKD